VITLFHSFVSKLIEVIDIVPSL